MNIRNKDRVKKTGEVFTPPELINDLLNKLPEDKFRADKTFFNPACGNGNMIIEILKRKLNNGHSGIQAVSTTYGIDIMPDNIEECQERVYQLLQKYDIEITDKIKNIVQGNIIQGNSLELDWEIALSESEHKLA